MIRRFFDWLFGKPDLGMQYYQDVEFKQPPRKGN